MHSHLGSTGNYNAISILHTLQFTVTHALGFSVFTSRILATDFISVSRSLRITHEVFFAPHNSFVTIILQLPTQFNSRQAGVPELDSSLSTTNSVLRRVFCVLL
jgi:hypothetical protein